MLRLPGSVNDSQTFSMPPLQITSLQPRAQWLQILPGIPITLGSWEESPNNLCILKAFSRFHCLFWYRHLAPATNIKC
jgi:hypothetical protein